MPERPLQHRDPDKKDDETLRKEARAHFASEPALQLVAELIARLRELDLPWWTPVRLRERWGAVERMRWFRERADLRQRITSALTGLAPKAARRKAPDFQGALVDSVIDDGDVTVRVFEEQFQPFELAVYGPAGAYWNFFRESMPWEQDSQVHHDLLAWLLKSLLSDRSSFDGIGRAPILTPWDVRTAIDGRVWHTRMPLEIRVAIDEARLQQERDRPGVPFHAEGDLSIAVPEIIASSIPLRDLIPVLNVAQKSMRFEAPRGAPKIEAGPPEPPHRAPEIVSPQAPAGPMGGPPSGLAGAPPPVMAAAPITSPPPPISSGPPTLAGGPPTVGGNPFLEGGRGGAPSASTPPPAGGPPQAPQAAFEAPSGRPPAGPPFEAGPGPEARGGPPVSGPVAKQGGGPAQPMMNPGSVPPPGMVAAGPPGPAGHGPPPGSGGPMLPPGFANITPPGGPSPSSPGSSGPPGFGPAAPPPGGSAKPGHDTVTPPPLVESARVGPQASPETKQGGPGPGAPTERPGASAPARAPSGGSSGLLALLNSIDAEDEMEMTNPYNVPSPEEIAAESARLPPPEAGSSKRRKA